MKTGRLILFALHTNLCKRETESKQVFGRIFLGRKSNINVFYAVENVVSKVITVVNKQELSKKPFKIVSMLLLAPKASRFLFL